MELGAKIRKLRKEQAINIEQFAQKAGLSIGLISQIERDITMPSVTSLWKIASALNVHINYFFDEYEDKIPIIRKCERKKLILPNSNLTYELLSPLNKKMELLLIKIEPGMCSSDELISHEGEECGYMIQGSMKIKWGSREYILNEGDSIYYNSTIPHRFINLSDVRAISIWTMTPPSF